ncbi:titin homolog [Portunus trituberculatus]|uniref:titin homolog n=1 Tax=Portunus trituberculatus TaxID=210409 RepID=UPI001E1CDC52|nr:titin homolog [Portunus trituberculatus]
MRTRLSTNAFYQSYDKGNKTVVDADQNCLPEEDTGTVSCLTHKLGSDRSVSDNRQCVDCQKETPHEVQGTEHGLLQLEGQKEHGSCDEAESTCLKNPEKKRLLFDKTLSTNTKVTRHDVNVTLETSVGNTEDKNECSVSSSSSAEDVPDTRTSCHSSELKSDKPENSTSGVDKKKRNGKKDKTERSKSQKVKHKLKNLINNTEEKKKQTPSTEEKENITPEHSIKSVENKYQDPNASLVKGTIADGDSPRLPKWTRSENDMMYRTIVRETETQSHDEASDDASQTVPETQSHDEASDDVLQTVSKTQNQLITSVNLSTEDRHTDKMQREENEATHRKQNEPVQEEENDKIRGKQNQEVQEKTKSKEQHCDETDVGKQTQSAQGERKSEEQVLNSTGQRKQKGVSSNSLEIDASRVCNQEYSQSSIDTLTAGQRERECTSSPEEPVPSSPCGQGFFVTQESKSGEPLLSPDGKESGSQKPGHEDLNIDELKELDLVDLDHYLLREQKEQYYCESIKDEENSLEVHSWHSDKTPGGLLESVSVAQGHKESCRPTACVTEEEASVKDEEGCDSITEVQDFEKCSGSNHKSPQKLLEKSVPKEDSEGSKALPKKSWPSKSKLQTPSTKHPIMPWCMLHVEDLPTPSMLDIVKHSDTSTPNTRGKQRQGRSGMCSSVTGTLKDTRITRRRSCVPHYLASWLEGLPLPDTDNSTPNGKSKDSDAHEARLKIPDAVLSSTSPKKKTLRESKNSLINSGMENSDSMLSDASTIKTENSSKKRKKNILACTDEGMTDLKGLEDSISQCGKDGEASAEPATQTSVPTAEEFVTINNKQECETRNDMCVSVTDGMDDLSILRDAEVSLEASPEKNTSSLIETDNNGLENDGEQCVEQDTQSGTNTDRLKGLPSNYEDQVDGLEISENVLKDNNHHSVGDFQCATQADWLKDLPLINVSEVTALVTSPDRNDTSKTNEQCSRKRKSSLRVLEMDWIKDLPISNENRQSNTETSLERDISSAPKAKDPTQATTKQNKKRKSERQKIKWSFNLPLDIKNKRRKSIMKWTEDLPLDIDDRRQESVMKWLEDLPLDIENKRRESVMKWTEDLPLDIEKTPACLQKSLHEHNTSRVDKTALSTNQCVDEENNEEEETHGTSSHSINKIDQESEAPSRRLTRAYWNSAIDSETDIIGERQKSDSIKEGDSVQEVNKSSDESPRNNKVTDSNPNRTLEESVKDGDCEKGNRDLKEERDKRNTNQEESERGSRGGNQRSNGHKECEVETTCYDANEDMTDGLKRKTGKTKQKECENNKDDSHKLSESIGHEESDGETSCCGVGDMEDGNKGKRKKTKQKGYEKSKDNRHEHSGNIGHEECAGETSYYGASDMEAESNENRESKTKTSLERDITPVAEAKDPTQTTTKQNKKRKKQEMKWTEDLPLILRTKDENP